MIRLFLISFLLIFSASSVEAKKKVTLKKRFKEAHLAIKNSSGQENIERILIDSLSRPTTTKNSKAEGYHICALLQNNLNEGLNMKAYLKQNIDTLKLYQTILKVYGYTLQSDSVDEKKKFENKNIRLRSLHRENLLGGGIYNLRKNNWDEAFKYFDMFLKTHTTDLDSVLGRVSYWATVCGMNANSAEKVLKHVDQAVSLSKKEDRPALLEYKARSYIQLGDSVSWLKLIEESVDTYPGYNYFFLNLMDYYMRHGQIERGLLRTDSLLRTDADRAVYWFALSMFALEQNDYEKCISMSEECLLREPNNIDGLYNKGISLLNLALTETNAAKRRQYYRRALEPMEKVRELSPDNIQRWGNPLYRIYLNLNMGGKFEEIDALLDKIQKNDTQSNSPVHVPNTGKEVGTTYKRLGSS